MTVRVPRGAARIAALALAGVLALGGCSGDAPASPAGAGPSKSQPPSADGPVVWPLTGVETKQVAERPALSVKIENSPESRPQTGLEHADVVWEEVVEGGITRFLAVYHSDIPKKVEPVRSVRPMDPAIVAPLDGVLAYSGAQKPFIKAVRASGTQSVIMDDGDAGFSRDRNRRAPHDVVGSPKEFLAQADDKRTAPPPAQFAFAPEVGKGTASTAGEPAGTVKVVLSPAQTSVWTWHGKSRTWVRSEGSKPSVSTSGDRHAARNVVLLSVKMVNTRYRDPSGARVPETKLTGTGKGVVASGGKVVAVEWSKKSVGERLVLTRDGKEVRLDPGSTWVELVPVKTGKWSLS